METRKCAVRLAADKLWWCKQNTRTSSWCPAIGPFVAAYTRAHVRTKPPHTHDATAIRKRFSSFSLARAHCLSINLFFLSPHRVSRTVITLPSRFMCSSIRHRFKIRSRRTISRCCLDDVRDNFPYTCFCNFCKILVEF